MIIQRSLEHLILEKYFFRCLSTSFTGDLIDYLYQLISTHFKTNPRYLQNLDYLTIQKEASVTDH